MVKKALVFGLGLLGGGVATTNWLIRHGYKVTVTDLKDEEKLRPSLKKIKGAVKLALGGHRKKLIEENDFIVVNPDVAVANPYLQLAKKWPKEVANEATIFYTHWSKKTAAITGTRGKTTTANWLNHFLKAKFKSVVTGNSYARPLLAILDQADKFDFAVTELPSFLLEFFDKVRRGPDIAVITNLFQDHLNRHGTMREYARTKSFIFKNQTVAQHLILNADNEWTEFFVGQKPAGQVWFFSTRELKKDQSGLGVAEGIAYFQQRDRKKKLWPVKRFVRQWGEHNLQNLLAAALAAHLSGVPWEEIKKRLASLPQVQFRQEPIFASGSLTIINDTVATSPEGGMAAIRRFGDRNCVLIAGGTDRQLDFFSWAAMVKERIKPRNLILLNGSATEKMTKELDKIGGAGMYKKCDSLAQCLELALRRANHYPAAYVVFSPAAKSFEKFKNEYDRGKKFNALVRKLTQF